MAGSYVDTGDGKQVVTFHTAGRKELIGITGTVRVSGQKHNLVSFPRHSADGVN